MSRTGDFVRTLVAGAALLRTGFATDAELAVAAGKSIVLDSSTPVYRVALANPEVAEAVVMSPREVVINGKAAGETSLLVWDKNGGRKHYDLRVDRSRAVEEAIQSELSRELAGQNLALSQENGRVFLRGDARDLVSAERAVAIAGALGPVVNLLYVQTPAAESQILLKVRFANVDRASISELGVNLFSTGAANTIGAVTTGQFSPPRFDEIVGGHSKVTLTDVLNVFLLRPDLNLGATIKALENRRLLDILAEPNLLAMNERSASFLAGGEFPFPTLQGGGAGLGAVTIQFREFGVRISFFPVITPRGTIRLEVTPEVSSLDFANGLVFQGFTIPGLSTRRVQTEVELRSGQSFAIAGLLDQRTSESWSKVPGIGDIPFFGKLFRSRALLRNNTELLVIVTPELVSTVSAAEADPAGAPAAAAKIPIEELLRSMAPKPRPRGSASTATAAPAGQIQQLLQPVSTPRAKEP